MKKTLTRWHNDFRTRESDRIQSIFLKIFVSCSCSSLTFLKENCMLAVGIIFKSSLSNLIKSFINFSNNWKTLHLCDLKHMTNYKTFFIIYTVRWMIFRFRILNIFSTKNSSINKNYLPNSSVFMFFKHNLHYSLGRGIVLKLQLFKPALLQLSLVQHVKFYVYYIR